MQKSFLKLTNISVSVLLMSAILVFLRCALLIFGFDFETSFFKNDTLAYMLYTLLIGVCAVSLAMSRNISPISIIPPKQPLTDILISLATVVFVCFAVIYTIKTVGYFRLAPYERNPLKTASFILCLPTAVLSAVFYAIRLFSAKEKSSLLSIFALSPVIFLSALLLERFATVSASAASLSHFPDIISLLILAFFMLVEGKAFIPTNGKSAVIPTSLITFITLSFSAIPDFITLIIGRNVLNFEGVLFLILKTVFTIYVFKTTALMARDMKETKE